MEKINKQSWRPNGLKKSIIFVSIILIGIALSVYLVLNYQTILSRAGSTDYSNFTVKDKQGNTLNPRINGDEVIYDTQSLEVEIQVSNLEKLSE